MTASEFKSVARFCLDKANEVSDENGFVPVIKLAKNLGAQITLRPLLVEAMLASSEVPQSTRDPRPLEWHVLLNSEKFDFKDWDLVNENWHSPLKQRARNTIAHELVHLILVKKFGVNAKDQHKSEKLKSISKIVKKIEGDVEKLSPLLLLPVEALKNLFDLNKPLLTIEDLIGFRKKHGVSRELVISRIKLLETLNDELLSRKCLQNIAIGIGQWKDDGRVTLLSWPIFDHIKSSHRPEFLMKLQSKNYTEIEKVFSEDDFFLNHGEKVTTQAEVNSGTIQHPATTKMRVELSVESTHKRDDSLFFFMCRLI